MIASLPMYDLPHLRGAHDRFWKAIRDALGCGPDHLTRSADPWSDWQAPDLLLSQTCSLPFRSRLHEQVQLVGTPDYGLPDCPPGYYFSYLIRRRDDTRDLETLAKQGVLAFNDPGSQSGYAAPLAHLAAQGLHPETSLQTHAHLKSVSAVLMGKADYAAIDAVTLMLWAADDPDAMAFLDAFDRTEPTPGLPYITARDRDPGEVARAVTAAFSNLSDLDRHDLRLNGLIQIPAETYCSLPMPAEIRAT